MRLNTGLRARAHRHLFRASKRLSRKGLYEFLIAECDALPDNIRVLNVGSGGDIGEMLQRQSVLKHWKVLTLDVNPERQPDVVASVEDFEGEAGGFEAVFLMEVLEHVRKPEQALANLHRLLAPGGRLVMSSPFLFPIHDAPEDHYRFTKYGLHQLLGDFEKVEVKARNGYFESLNVQAARVLTAPSGNSIAGMALALLSIYLFRYLAPLADRILKTGLGTTGYVATARKSS